MSPAYQIHVVFLQEPGNHVRAEGEGDTTVILAPTSNVLVRIRPQQVAEEAAIGNLFKLACFVVMWDHVTIVISCDISRALVGLHQSGA